MHSLVEKEVVAVLAACGTDGLMVWRGGWQRMACPLPCPEMLALQRNRLAVLDNTAHAVWTGQRIIPVDSGVEAMLLWGEHLLTLSGDTDCLTLLSLNGGGPLLTIPVGVYPQDMCLLPGSRSLAVCGGADGMIHIIRLPELWEEQTIRLPGHVHRATCLGGVLYALCTVEDAGLCCQLCSIRGGRCRPLARWPGLPGAIHRDDTGCLWVAASEVLCRFHKGEYHPLKGEFGLIRHMDSRRGMLLISDPVMEQCSLITADKSMQLLYEGEIGHAVFRQ